MKGSERLAQVALSTPRMGKALPTLSMPGTVMVRLLRITQFGLGTFFEPVFRSLGLTENTFHVLCLLVANPDGSESPSQLSEMVGTSRANMTRLLEELIGDGHVKRAIDPRDARRHIITITAKGRAKALEAAPKLREPMESAFADLSAEEFALLDRVLRKLIVSLDKSPKRLRMAA
jgi:MarR family transcriptional regulator, negative regulator of the multidrug operon emrRAB